MDIVLERILSLIPKKPDGKYIHGAKKEFAQSIGYDGGDIVSMWINGSSKSYMGKLHEIAAKYNVSVEWLKGETDIKNPASTTADGWEKEAIQLLSSLSLEARARELAYLREIVGEQDTKPGPPPKDT